MAIATPHSKSCDPKDWNHLKLLVGLRKRHKKGPTATLVDAKRLSDLSLHFEEVVMNLYILTFCEVKDTAIKSLLIRGSKDLVSSGLWDALVTVTVPLTDRCIGRAEYGMQNSLPARRSY